jgi:hypothetical protein
MRLEIPVRNRDVPIPQEILNYAKDKGIRIVDPEGHVYNP